MTPERGHKIMVDQLAMLVRRRGGSCSAGWRLQCDRLMHADVARHWKVADLAREVAMSRTTFAERFKTLLGVAPLEYLTRWRMMIARNALQRGDASLTVIATTVGYESDTAFSLAFKRTFGCSPGKYRKMERTTDDAPGPVGRIASGG